METSAVAWIGLAMFLLGMAIQRFFYWIGGNYELGR